MITNNNFKINNVAFNDAILYCKSHLPNEACGIISDNKFIPFTNKAEDKKSNFKIDDPLYFKLIIEDKVDCIIHSHLNYPHASINDQIQQESVDIPFGIINFNDNTVTHFIFWGNIPKEHLLGRQFFFGVFDCAVLCRDFIKDKFDININIPHRSYKYWLTNEKLFEEFMESNSYNIKYVDDIKINDLIFYKINSNVINHVGILIDNNIVLHHFCNRLSGRYSMNVYRDCIYKIGRIFN